MSALARPSRGFALIVALVMLALIALASAAVMRDVSGGAQLANGGRLQVQADQSAQLALRWCEAQLALSADARAVAPLPAADPPAWTALDNWMGTRPGSVHTLTADEIGGAVAPRVAPQCLLEATGTATLYTVTARGFSADFTADPGTGATRAGAAVWLQATIHRADAASAAASSAARQRVWQRLLTPPF